MAPTTPAPPPTLAAPLWHTILLLFFLLVPWSWWLPFLKIPSGLQHEDLPFIYIIQLQFQWILFLIMWLGLLAGPIRFRELIGNRWKTASDFFRDLGLGTAVMMLNLAVAFVIVVLFRPTHHHSSPLDPHKLVDLIGFIPIALTAGFTEEAICRGYLQRQLHALTGSPAVAIGLQAAIFSLSHGYELPIYNLTAKFIVGVAFGMLAFRRKSLLPGMLGHSAQDCLVGFAFVFS